jgi:F-type H+-transporting ATPase subunit alpha
VAVIYAGTRGYLDKIPASQVTRYESELLSQLRTKNKPWLEKVRTGKTLTPELEAELKSILEAFSAAFA